MRMSLKRRGISPLIATVLLIGFVIAISLLAMLWGRTLIKEQIEKRAPVAQQKLECQTDVEVNVKDSCYDPDYSAEIGRVTVQMENKKKTFISGIRGRITGSDGISVVLGSTPLYEYETKFIDFDYPIEDVGTPQTIELMPMIYDSDSGITVTCNQGDIVITSKIYTCN